MRTKRPRSWGRHAWILPALGAVLWLAAVVWPRMVAMEPSPFVQLWPWLQERHPAVHRASGRIYVFAGVLPCSVLVVATMLLKVEPYNTVIYFWTAMWLAATVTAFRRARQARYAEHRRWMAYSVALTMGIGWSPVIGGLAFQAFRGIQPALLIDLLGWVSWVLNLGIAALWLKTTARRGLRTRAAASPG